MSFRGLVWEPSDHAVIKFPDIVLVDRFMSFYVFSCCSSSRLFFLSVGLVVVRDVHPMLWRQNYYI